MFFDLQHQNKNTHARAGVIHTDHGDIKTPVFMPVGTQATIKSLDSSEVEKIDAQIILGNTYHLHLRPGEDLINDFGGLHKFMNWNKPILTDSGGFQVFSLGLQKSTKIAPSPRRGGLGRGLNQIRNTNRERDPLLTSPYKGEEHLHTARSKSTALNNQGRLASIDEDGVIFTSHIDGSRHRFTPEKAIEIQHKLGADIIMAFDECTPDGIDEKYTREAMERTHRWAKRCVEYHKNIKTLKHENNTVLKPYRQFLFGIIQGSNHKHLREESAKYISSLDCDGIAIGGESIGYNMEATKNILDWIYPIILKNKPHYAMGIGFSPLDLFDAVEHGADMFDCVSPTRMARNGALFVHPRTYMQINGDKFDRNLRINITNAKFFADKSTIDPLCDCSTCQNYTRAYLHHLFNAQELLAYKLATIHNLHFFLDLARQIRQSILTDSFLEYKKGWLAT